jgi:hypothetical protein
MPTFAWNDKESQEVNAIRYVYTHAWLKRLGLSKCESNRFIRVTDFGSCFKGLPVFFFFFSFLSYLSRPGLLDAFPPILCV